MKIKKILAISFFILLIMSLLLGTDKLIKIKKITCRSQDNECSQTVSDILNESKNKGIFSGKREIGKKLNDEFYIKKYSFHYQPPSELIVNIVERKPRYTLDDPSIEWIALVDSDGYSLSLQEASDLPTLQTQATLPNPGNKVSEETLFALEVFSAIEKSYNLQTASLINGSLLIELDDEINVLFPLEGDKQVLLGSFVFIYNQVKDNQEIAQRLNGSDNLTIDLRYNNPVIR